MFVPRRRITTIWLAHFQIPNPLFDLAGITCGHFLVPFWTFFGATLIGKAIIKMHIQVSSTVEALIRGGLNLAERRFTSNSSMFFPFFNISPTGPRTCSILPSNMIHLLFHVVALLCPQCNNASQKSSHRKKTVIHCWVIPFEQSPQA